MKTAKTPAADVLEITDPQGVDRTALLQTILQDSMSNKPDPVSFPAEADPTPAEPPVEPAVRPNLARSRELARAAAETALASGGTNIVVLDMTALTSIFDYFVIVTGISHRQLAAMSEDIRMKLEKDLKDRRLSSDGVESGKWIVLDFGSVVIHLFDEDTRQFYSLEALWADAPDIAPELGIAGGDSRSAARGF